MKQLIQLITVCITLSVTGTAFGVQLIGSVKTSNPCQNIDFYRLDKYKDMNQFSQLQSQLERVCLNHKSQSQNADDQKMYNQRYRDFKNENADIIIGLDQQLKLISFCFLSKNGSYDPTRVYLPPQIFSLMDSAGLEKLLSLVTEQVDDQNALIQIG